MLESFEVSDIFPVSPEELYSAWLDSKKHGAFTGSKAKIDPKVGGKFTAWDGYIEGETVKLEPNKKILQKWRTTEFPEDSKDSKLELIFEEVDEGTKLTIKHSDVPEGQAKNYKPGWDESYFQPMQEYFE
ncbi:SRPBCC domain-containing protein [Patescibacteria group bacterium]|nr:SRPBCC domain-containing protein [Patescibacteria group bacterium]MBU1673989.1 SRPBCC domain-containing protein [Patescibacteria group bacterium]MBU1962938.1 SRPBCC domain-containing protein [Patescibacteria group bacterium]